MWLLYQPHCRYSCFLTKMIIRFRNANFAYIPLMSPAGKPVVHPPVSMVWGICLLFVSSRQLKFISTKNIQFLVGQVRLRAEKELSNVRIWSICVQEIDFCCQMPWAHHQCWHLLRIHLCLVCWAILSPFQSFFLVLPEDPWASRSCCSNCWAVHSHLATSLWRLKNKNLWICSFMETQKCRVFFLQSTWH